jgi:SAM-dependent methyltransferase
MKAEERWRDVSGQRWVELAERTDAQLGPLGRAVMDLVAPAPGERVLDVGCGAGQSVVQLAGLVGETGRVVGLDISEPLLAAAQKRIDARGLANAELVLGNAATATFPEPFDVAFSRFGVMFFEDSVAAFGNIGRALRSGGRLGFVSWQPLEDNPWAHAPLAAARTLAPELPAGPMLEPGQPGPFFLSSAALVTDILSRAGFAEVRVVRHEPLLRLGGARTVDEAVDYLLQIGPAARFLTDAGLVEDERARDVIARAVAPFLSEQGVMVPSRVLLVTARRP